MAEAFSAPPAASNVVDISRHIRKFDAAKEQLAKAVLSMRPHDAARVVLFSDAPECIPLEFLRDTNVGEALSAIEPAGNTDIGAPLHLVANTIRDSKLRERYRYVNVVIVSDGLSTVGDPLPAADHLSSYASSISTVLIDATDQGRRLADAISIGGSVYPVGSAAQLDHAFESARDGHTRRVRADRQPFTTHVVAWLSFWGLLSGISGYTAEKILDSTGVGLLVFGTAALLILAGWLVAHFFEREEYYGIIVPPRNEPPLKRRFVHSRRVMILASAGCLVCLCLGGSLFSAAWIRHKAEKAVTQPAPLNTPMVDSHRQGNTPTAHGSEPLAVLIQEPPSDQTAQLRRQNDVRHLSALATDGDDPTTVSAHDLANWIGAPLAISWLIWGR